MQAYQMSLQSDITQHANLEIRKFISTLTQLKFVFYSKSYLQNEDKSP